MLLVKSRIGNVNVENGFPHLRMTDRLMISVPQFKPATKWKTWTVWLREKWVTWYTTDRDMAEQKILFYDVINKKNLPIRWVVTENNIESIDAIDCFRIHVRINIFQKVFKTFCIQGGHTLNGSLDSFSLPHHLNKIVISVNCYGFFKITFPTNRGLSKLSSFMV